MYRSVILIAPLLSIVLSTSCWVPKETGKIMQDDIAELKANLRDVRKGLDEQQALESEHMQATLKKFEELSTALQEFNHSARLTDADFGSQMERMIHDVQELRGAVEVNEHRIGETEQTLAQRLDALTKQTPAESAEPTPAAAADSMPKDKHEALAYGAKLIKDDKVSDARAVYRSIIKQWPKEGGVADEAMFRLGETYYGDKKYEAALREYIPIVYGFGNGPLADDAYYKIGLCSIELGRLEDAQTFLNEIVSNHKKSPLLKNARAKLDEVNRRIEQNKAKKGGKKGR